MGRARKPKEMQKGNLTVEQQVQMEQAEAAVMVSRDQLVHPPRWLIDATARKEWKRVTAILAEIEIIGNLDLNNIGGYCNAYSLYIRAVNEVNEPGNLFDKDKLDCMKKYADEMRRFAALCGLTVDSRLKAGAYVAGKKDDDISDMFGDI